MRAADNEVRAGSFPGPHGVLGCPVEVDVADDEHAEADRRGAKRAGRGKAAGRDLAPQAARPAPEGGEAKRLFSCRRFD